MTDDPFEVAKALVQAASVYVTSAERAILALNGASKLLEELNEKLYQLTQEYDN